MQDNHIFVSDLSTSTHTFHRYHFCRGNSNRRKTRIGIILKGEGAYIYLNQKLNVREGDVVLIPEHIYCYSEWRGSPEIEVVYLSCFLHYEAFKYEPQLLSLNDAEKSAILQISQLLGHGEIEELEGYSLFYKLLQVILPQMKPSNIAFDKTLQNAIEYITANWNDSFSVAELAKHCCVSESTLYHLFQKELGQTPIHFLNSVKINVAIESLENTTYSVATIAALVGFRSENHFRKVFSELVGTTPLKYRKSPREAFRSN